MSDGYETWLAVDTLIADTILPTEPRHALAAAAAADMPPIAVSAPQGALLRILALSIGARRILEVGTLAGYSTLWLAQALPADGELVTLEVAEEHARVARRSLDGDDRISVIVGPALESLAALEGPFDLTFIDADKVTNPHYVREALRLSRSGSLIVVDNIVRNGTVLEPESDEPAAAAHELLGFIAQQGFTATVVQTVGSKGYDGFCLIRVP
jgi:predicted O-methyltransferase YrrM